MGPKGAGRESGMESNWRRFDREAAGAFFLAWYGEDCAGDFSCGLGGEAEVAVTALYPSKNGARSRASVVGWGSTAIEVVELCAPAVEDRADVYFNVCAMDPSLVRGEHSRGEEKAVVRMFGLWADVDVADPGKASRKNYAGSLDDARALVESMPMRPSIVVRSGGGLHAYWTFDEPVVIESDEDRLEAQRLSRGWLRLLQHLGAADGIDVDDTFDLARIMRVPGSIHQRLGRHVRVDSTLDDVPRYPPSDLRDAIPSEVWATSAARPRAPRSEHVSETGENGEVEVQARFRGIQRERFVLRRAAEIPGCVAMLCEIDADFAATWNRNRSNLKDQSQSTYDLAIATRLAGYKVAPQEIVDACVRHRLDANPADPKWSRSAYYVTLLAKAYEPIERERREKEVEQEREQLGEIVDEVAQGERARDEAAPQIRDILRGFFPSIDEIDVVCNPGNPPQWSIRTADSAYTMKGGAGDVLNFNAFRAAFAQVTRRTIPPHSPKEWAPIAAAIITLAREEKLGHADSPHDEVREWIGSFLEAAPPAKSEEQGLAEDVPFRDEAGEVWASIRRIHRYVRDSLGERGVETKKIAAYMRALGISYERRAYVSDNGKKKLRTVYPISRVMDGEPDE